LLTAASDGEAPFVLAPFLLGFIDSILFFVMPKEEFDDKYNSRRAAGDGKGRERFASEGYRSSNAAPKTLPRPQKVVADPYKRLGIEKFRSFDYLGAIEAFQKSLQQNYESPSTHFNLACSYSMLELPQDAFFHLEKSVEFGFDAFEKIDSHQALAYLRLQPEFEGFVRNNYRVPTEGGLEDSPERLELKELRPEPARPVEEEQPSDLLDQLMQLGELMEKGLLSEEEFIRQKQKLLRD
jgi:tetratricopeptide (TPR) repeat protein